VLELPDFPWDALAPHARRAAEHPGGMCDLSVGTPVDPVPQLVRERLRATADTPGYPTARGSGEVRSAAAGWMKRRLGVPGVDPEAVMSVVGSKEFVAWLPLMLGLGSDDLVVIPELAYPTYAIGAKITGSPVVAADSLLQLGPDRPALLWVNSPSNPTGRVLGREHLAKIVSWARERGVVVASDECYIELGWDEQPVSILHPDVCGGSFDGLLAVHSLSKRSNLAGYRFGFVAGDPALVEGLVGVAKHTGMMVPAPVQAAAATALADDEHVSVQRRRYRGRRELLWSALTGAGFSITDSAAGLYLWATAGEPCWETVSRLAEIGILVAPGDLYGPGGSRHVRIAITATDEAVRMACERLLAGV